MSVAAPVAAPRDYSSFLDVGAPDDLGNRDSTFTAAGARVFAGWFRRRYVDDSKEQVSVDDVATAFGDDPEGIPQYGPSHNITEEAFVETLRGAGVRFADGGISVFARPRDGLGVHYGKQDVGERVDMIGGLIPRASVVLVVGLSGACKSWFLAELAVAYAYARPAFGRFATPDYDDRAAYVNTDQPVRTNESRLQSCGDNGRVGRCNFPDLSPAEPPFWSELKRALAPSLVIVDTLGGATPGASERDSGFALPLKLARRYANETDGAVIFCHHSGKEISGPKTIANVARGTSALGGDVDVMFHLEKVQAAGPKERRARVTCIKFRAGADIPAPFTIQVLDGKVSIVGAEQTMAETVLDAVRADPGQSATTLAKTLGKRKAIVLGIIKELGSKVETRGNGSASRLFPGPEQVPGTESDGTD